MILNVNINYPGWGLIGGSIKNYSLIKSIVIEAIFYLLGAVLGAIRSMFSEWAEVSNDNFFLTITCNHERKKIKMKDKKEIKK